MTDEEKNKVNNEDEEEIVVEENIDEANPSFQEKLEKIKEKLKKCQELKDEYLNGWQRAKADLINARKEDERRNQEFLKFANASLIFEILPVLDSFELALAEEPSFAEASASAEASADKSAGKQDSKFSKGIFLIKMQLGDVLRKFGLEPIKSIGEKANLQFHEIVGEIESEKEENVIIEELQKGYLLNGKIIRPAKVKVSKNK